MMGYDFHRQKPLDNYIADFFCHELMLAIEVDGYTHTFEEVVAKDKGYSLNFRPDSSMIDGTHFWPF